MSMDLGRITVRYWLTDDGQPIVSVDVEPEDPQQLPILTQLGMLDLARDTLLHPADSAGDTE